MNNKIKPLLIVIAVTVIISVINVSASASDERLSEAKNLIYAISCGNIDITENDEEVNKTDEITRSEFVMHAVELFGKNASASETVSFKDVDSESELYNALCKAVSMQMVTDSEAFRPIAISDTIPTNIVENDSSYIEHEATVSKVSEDQLFYLMSRGLTEAQATEMIVMGFIEPFAKELPMEYAVELNQLIKLEMKDSIG